ncbi:hypothetical protein Cgig2_027682 [Carnegiea gigantea]|uniref:Uncharacterized protein n=1 Tax=Carnegiea gigantea TaxID=171969 RepID=A0A9Q1GVM9_9CARY|nr:hypothetical protein Cgig2_027682 [Carnegiea gigantea]
MNDWGNRVSPQGVAMKHLPGMGSTQQLKKGGELEVRRPNPLSGDGMVSEEGLVASSSTPEDYQDLCPSFTVLDTEEAVCNFNIPEIVQATFYVMLPHDAVGPSLMSKDVARGLKVTLEGLRWTTFESWLNVSKRALLEVQLRQRIPPEGGPRPAGG